MAKLTIDGDELVVRLARWEKAAARQADIRVPLAAVDRVAVQPDAWRALRGVRESGVVIPGTLWLGIWRHPRGRDFAAVRPKRRGVVCVDLHRPSPFARVSATCEYPEPTVAALRKALSPAVAAATDGPDPVPAADPGLRPAGPDGVQGPVALPPDGRPLGAPAGAWSGQGW
ncbi:hypothetical protein GCM10009665_48270 [Kitasatospora nipponensis]|uniref:Uncharacterized protein n=1 Tax=Kitasatospora nipponensis TaxID=258049 RepID=A0ABN1WJB9_9ACTN